MVKIEGVNIPLGPQRRPRKYDLHKLVLALWAVGLIAMAFADKF